ncbi:SCO family protein [Pelagovum pacificum]|uniref:SCO family protein n=1 Tax=Pelagovum pacificum TaxID=2588711 RepID=A0A5C5GI77_9RHOB|nr:SCO family protein [Pelagovum pacificum]QQA42755.1 SCO family protein [Pelagovum pacificum]TNY34403.1 SCO family protein [Pelagovum pacificum]
MKRNTLLATGAVGVVVLALGGTFLWTEFAGSTGTYAQCTSGAVGGDIGGPFELVSETGETVTDEDVLTEPSLVYFGYTFCPDVCPVDTDRTATAVTMLEDRGYDVQPVFVSVDPHRDTPEVLTDYTDAFHPDMLGLTGSKEQIDAAAQAYKVYYNVHDDEDPDYYLVDHTAMTYLMMPGEGFIDFFRREATPEEMADRVQCVLDAAN